MKQIKISDSTYEVIKREAEKNFRTIGGQVDFLLHMSQPVFEDKKAVVQEVEKYIDKKYRTVKDILNDINAIKSELGEPDTFNQDPDYWEYRKEKEQEIQQLWEEWRLSTSSIEETK